MGPEAFGSDQGGGLNSAWSHASSERWCSESRPLDLCILRHLGAPYSNVLNNASIVKTNQPTNGLECNRLLPTV